MLITGSGVEKEFAEAERLLRDAAERGRAQAQNDLDYAILSGTTGGRDYLESATWCKLAVAQATDTNVLQRAKVNLGNALSWLSADERQEMERRVKNYQPRRVGETDPNNPCELCAAIALHCEE